VRGFLLEWSKNTPNLTDGVVTTAWAC
jgi:hypothetical protein